MNNTSSTPPPALFSLRQVTVSTFLSGPLGGAILMAINRRRIDDREGAGLVLMLGILGFVGLLVVTLFLPANFPTIFLLALQLMVVRGWYDQDQSSLYDRNLVNGGRQASWWIAIGLSLCVMVVVLLVVGLFLGGGFA
jgi:hypothetical protein